MINGVTELIMMKADVLNDFDEIKVCTKYKLNGKEIDYLPYDYSLENLEPVYDTLPGWKKELTGVKSMDDIPPELFQYVSYLEHHLEVPISIVSVGPDRTQTLLREN